MGILDGFDWSNSMLHRMTSGGDVCQRRKRYCPLFCAFTVVITFLLTACASSQVDVGGFSVLDSHTYEVKKSNPLHTTQVADGRELETCDAHIMLNGSSYGIGAIWYDGITFNETKAYLEGRVGSGETVFDERLSLPLQEWKSAGKEDVILSGGTPGYLSKEESVAELGAPYAYYSEILIFPTSENSVGMLTLLAHSLEQKEAEQALLEEVMGNIAIDR